MAKQKQPFRQIIETEVSGLAIRAAGLSFLFEHLKPEYQGPHDHDAFFGIGVLLSDLENRARTLRQLMDYRSREDVDTEVETNTLFPDPASQVLARHYEPDMEIRLVDHVEEIQKALELVQLPPDDRILQLRTELVMLEAEKRGAPITYAGAASQVKRGIAEIENENAKAGASKVKKGVG